MEAYEATWNTLNQEHEAWQAVDFRRSLRSGLRELTQLLWLCVCAVSLCTGFSG